MTIPEYLLLMEAVRLRQIDMDYRNHLQAWLTFAAKATNKRGQPRYRKFKRFYDYEGELRKATVKTDNEKSRFSGIGKFFKKGE